MYLVLRPPWAGADDAGDEVAMAPGEQDAGVGPTRPGKKAKRAGKRRRGGAGAGGGDEAGGAGAGGGAEVAAPVLTDADRRLEWRGDAVSLPPRRFDMTEGGDEARPLDDGEIGSTVSRRGDGAIDCMVKAATGTDLSGTITVRMLVGGDGKVGKVRVNAPRYMHEQGLLPCVRRATARFYFPATGAPTLVTAPFELE